MDVNRKAAMRSGPQGLGPRGMASKPVGVAAQGAAVVDSSSPRLSSLRRRASRACPYSSAGAGPGDHRAFASSLRRQTRIAGGQCQDKSVRPVSAKTSSSTARVVSSGRATAPAACSDTWRSLRSRALRRRLPRQHSFAGGRESSHNAYARAVRRSAKREIRAQARASARPPVASS